jgi:hypothetical protein
VPRTRTGNPRDPNAVRSHLRLHSGVERTPEGNRTPVACLEGRCLGHSATGAVPRKYRWRDSNPHGTSPRRSERRASAFRHSGLEQGRGGGIRTPIVLDVSQAPCRSASRPHVTTRGWTRRESNPPLEPCKGPRLPRAPWPLSALPLQGSNLDSPGSAPGVLPVTPRSRVIDEIRTRFLRGHGPALNRMSFNHHGGSGESRTRSLSGKNRLPVRLGLEPGLTGRDSNPHRSG